MGICLTRSLFYVCVCLAIAIPYPLLANYIDNRLKKSLRILHNKTVMCCRIGERCFIAHLLGFHWTQAAILSLYCITWWHALLSVCIETSFVQSIYTSKPKPETGFSFAKSITLVRTRNRPYMLRLNGIVFHIICSSVVLVLLLWSLPLCLTEGL